MTNEDNLKAYSALQKLRKERRKFESKHREAPYSQHKTDINFNDMEGNSVLYYAAAMGDLRRVEGCITSPNINLKSKSNIKAMEAALRNGYLDIAEYLFQQGINCIEIDLSVCADEKTKNWFSEKIRIALAESFPDPAKNFSTPKVINPFFENFFMDSTFPALKRAVEIGDIDFIRKAIYENKLASFWQIVDKKLDNLIILAASNGQLEMLKFLLQIKTKDQPANNYTDTPLMAAIKNSHLAVVDYLLKMNVDVNKEDKFRNTALTYAVDKADIDLINTLIKHGADINKTNISGNNLLHLAVKKNSKILNALLHINGFKELINQKNIFGRTPIDLAIQNKNEEAIRSLDPSKDLNFLKQSSAWGMKATFIHQNNVLQKMLYYLTSQYRDTRYFEVDGHCNGFDFLKLLYTAKGMEQYFFSTLALMADWDGEESSLDIPLKNIPQAAYYNTLREVFEQWINDVIWFQHSALKEIDSVEQHDRLSQYQIIKDKEEYDYHYYRLYAEINFASNFYKRTSEQLTEILFYLTRMPKNTQFEFSGDTHTTAANINQENIFVYYDSNICAMLENTTDLKENVRRIIDYKYILIEKFKDNFIFKMNAFCFEKDINKLDLDHFEILKPEELPRSKDDALRFQQKSPNQFTPLHVAIMTRSLTTIKKLITDGFCDVNAKDALGRSAIELASDNHFDEATTLLLTDPCQMMNCSSSFFSKTAKDHKEGHNSRAFLSHGVK